MAATNYYVDPLNGDDGTGDGSIGTPWQTIQHALDTIVRNTTDGDQINIRNTATITLTASLNVLIYGTPTYRAPLIFRGYTNTADDGGVATIVGSGVFIFNQSIAAGLRFRDLDMSVTSGVDYVVYLGGTSGSYVIFIDCTLSGSDVSIIHQRGESSFYGCHVHSFSGNIWQNVSGGAVSYIGCFLEADIAQSASNNQVEVIAYYNICKNVSFYGYPTFQIFNNIFYNNSGVGVALSVRNGATGRNQIVNNLFCNFSGVGQRAISQSFSLEYLNIVAGNAFYNCTIPVGTSGYIAYQPIDNLILSIDPLTDPDNNDFTLADVSELQSLGWPGLYPSIVTADSHVMAGFQAPATIVDRKSRVQIFGR